MEQNFCAEILKHVLIDLNVFEIYLIFFMTEKKIDELIKKIQKENIQTVSPYIDELDQYVEENSKYILNHALSRFLEILELKQLSGDLQAKTIHVLAHLIDKLKDDLQEMTNLLQHPKLLSILFAHTNDGNIDLLNLLTILFILDPDLFQNFIIKSPETVLPLIECIIKTQKEEAGAFLTRLIGTSEPVLRSLLPEIKPRLKEFPVSVSINFIIASAELKMPLEEFEKWLCTEHSSFTASDIEMCVRFYPDIWQSQTMITLMRLSTPSPNCSYLNFCSYLKPQNFTISEQDVKDTCTSLLDNKNLEPGSDMEASFYFFRLYVLSFADPSLLNDNAKEMIYRFIQSPNEFLAASAIQCVTYWAVNQYKNQIPTNVTYLIAASSYLVDRTDDFKILVRAAVKAFAWLCTLTDEPFSPSPAVIISKHDENLKFTEDDIKRFNKTTPKWLWPHTKKVLPLILESQPVDKTNIIDLLVDVSTQFEFVDQLKSSPEKK